MVSRLWRASHQRRVNFSWLFIIACICCTQAISASAEAMQDSVARPNIIILYADDMGWGDAGAYGHPYIKTPSLDRLANEGQRWTDFYVPAPVCSPSRAALLTGRHPVRSGLYGVGSPVLFPDDKYGIPQSEVTLAEMLKDAGYRTAIMGGGTWVMRLNIFPHAMVPITGLASPTPTT